MSEEVAEYVFRVLQQSCDDGVRVGESWLAAEMQGLFAHRQFTAGEVVCHYVGMELRTTDALRLADKSYLMRLGPQVYVDARPCPLVKARFINDCINPAGWNVRFEKRPDLIPPQALVVAMRDIGPGEELFADYGKWYWTGCDVKPTRIPFAELHKRRELAKAESEEPSEEAGEKNGD